MAQWLTTTDPAGLLYGAIVSAAVLAAVSAHGDDSAHVALATAVVVVVYWMAHVYIDTLSRQFEGDRRGFLHRLHSSSGQLSVLKGGLPGILVYLGVDLAGADKDTAAAAAVYFSVVLLAAVGYLGAHQAGLRGRAMLIEVAGAASFGVLIVVAKALLH